MGPTDRLERVRHDDGNFQGVVGLPWPRAGDPDVVFEVRQNVGGVERDFHEFVDDVRRPSRARVYFDAFQFDIGMQVQVPMDGGAMGGTIVEGKKVHDGEFTSKVVWEDNSSIGHGFDQARVHLLAWCCAI